MPILVWLEKVYLPVNGCIFYFATEGGDAHTADAKCLYATNDVGRFLAWIASHIGELPGQWNPSVVEDRTGPPGGGLMTTLRGGPYAP